MTETTDQIIQAHWYDLWEDGNGNYAYLNTNIAPEQMEDYENEFIKANPVKEEEEDWEDYENRFIDFLRSQNYMVHVINRPWTSIDVARNH